MGSIASVLQWHCEECSLINPTERVNCVRCGFSRDGENTGWKQHNHGDVKQNNFLRGANDIYSTDTRPPVKNNPDINSSLIRRLSVTKGKKRERSYSWGSSNFESSFSLVRSASICTITRHWCCVQCKFNNITVCSSCVGCGYIKEKDYQKTFCKKDNLLITMDSFNPNWFSDDTPRSPVKNSEITPVGTPHNLNSVIDSQTLNRSPKRQSPSMYERVKSKVSRSLSNGSVVQKLWLENSPKSVLFKRPTSLLVDTNSSLADVNKNNKEESDINALYAVVNKNRKKPPVLLETWTCQRCTLENSVSFERCEVCETPRKPENTLPRNGVVITVPEWGNDVDSSKPKSTIYKTSKIIQNNPSYKPASRPVKSNSPSQDISEGYNKPVYRRCYSEVNTPNPETSSQNKILANRKSMIETDVQNNLLLKSPVSNLNINSHSPNLNSHKSGRLRYSYIGITDPAAKPFLNDSSFDYSDGSKQGSLRKRTLPIPPMDLQVKEPPSTVSYTVSSPYHNSTSQKSSTQSSLNTTPDSIPEITVINSLAETKPYDRMWQSENGIDVIDGRNSYDCMWQSTNETTSESKNNSRLPAYDRLWSLEQNSDNQSSNKTRNYDKMWEMNTSLSESDRNSLDNTVKDSKLNQLDRMWTCIKCSFAYNPIWSDCCDICNSERSPPSLTEPSLITVTKDSVRYTPPKENSGYIKNVNQKSKSGNDCNLNWSHGVGPVTLATLEQDLEDDFQFLPGAEIIEENEESNEEWTCKKCTLVSKKII